MSESTARDEHSVGRAPDLRDLGEELLRILHTMDYHAGGVYLSDPESSALAMSVLTGITRDFMRPWFRISATNRGPVTEALYERKMVWLPSGEEMAKRYPRLAIVTPYDYAFLSYPLLGDGGELHGAFFLLGTSCQHFPSSAERRALAEVAKRMVDLLRQAREEGHPVLPAPAPFVLRSPPPEEQAADSLAAAVDRLPEGLCALDSNGRVAMATDRALELLSTKRERLIGSRPWSALPWLDNPSYEDRYRAAVFSHRSAEFVALRPPNQWLSFRLHPGQEGVSVLITPTEAEWGSEELRQEERGHARAGVLYHILHLASALTEAATVSDVTDLVAEEIVPGVGAHALALFEHNQERHRLRLLGQRGFKPDFVAVIDGAPTEIRAPATRAAVTGLPGFFRTKKELLSVYPDMPYLPNPGEIEGWAFVPLVASGRPIGVCMIGFRQPHNFTVQERTVLTSLGGLVAQALERARLYDIKRDLARGLQSGMLPRRIPEVPGLSIAQRYLSGTEGMDIGGDFYDLIPLGSNRVAAVIGDVQGHNVGAAALMGQLRTAVLAYTAMLEGSPGDVLTQSNRLLCMLEPELFASCLFLRLDLDTGMVRMARAGHPEPVMGGPGGGRVLDAPDGLLLGIEPDVKYPEIEFPMPEGSTLALYTDGLIERPGVDLEEAQETLAHRLASLHDMTVEQVADELTSAVSSVPHRSDDIALFLLRAQPG
ncbi:SpoIIE family protein phosphatase [Nocardiopsis sp. CNT312]|uniref:SpoIIE family protein phosphatase n=1 Tax=Nocardiopsis sp. CNT312 TaxID=1137268 RepID=UPI00048DFEBD|nr:SpoIIE family protein phosphatase [Nocardiopsis sp. CNT312]